MSEANCVTKTELTEAVRSAVQDRAAWLYLLIKEFQAAGYETDEPVKKALFKYGQLNSRKMGAITSPKAFFDGIGATGNAGLPFAREDMGVGTDKGVYHLHHCPLVEAWKNLGATSEEIIHLCDLAYCGDAGLISGFPGLDLKFNETIAKGDAYCEMVVTRR
jgi:hypothetical protein